MKQKFLLFLLVTVWLIFNSTAVAMAQFGQAYFEYKKYDGYNDYYAPKIGSYWGIENKFLVFLGHNLSGYDDDYLGVGYTFFKKIYAETKYENNEDDESISFKISRSFALKPSLSLYGEISNISYNSKVWKDYQELKYYAGLQWQVNSNLTLSSYLYLIEKDVDYGATNYDSQTFGRTVGFQYHVSKPLIIWGNYRFTDLGYQERALDQTQAEKNEVFAAGVTYNFYKYSIYFSYDRDVDKTIADLPATRTSTAILGISYNFY
jgi:hypothetical protein